MTARVLSDTVIAHSGGHPAPRDLHAPDHAVELLPPDPPAYDPGSTGNRYSDDTRALAFQAWAYECDRFPTDTAHYLKAVHGIEIHPETIRRWARAGTWGELANAALRELAPDLNDAADALVVRAKPMARRKLVDMVAAIDPNKYNMAEVTAVQTLLAETERVQAPADHAGALDTSKMSGPELMNLLKERILADKAGDR